MTKKQKRTIDLLGWSGILVAVILGLWGIRLTYIVIDTSVDIKHFDTLLNKTDSSLSKQTKLLSDNGTIITLSQIQIDSLISINKKLSQQLNIISNQYLLNLKEQKLLDSNSVNIKLTNEARFYVSTQRLHSLIWQPYKYPGILAEWPIPLRTEFLNQATAILNEQLDNPFLLSNKSMLEDWLNVRDSLVSYMQEINFLPQQPIDTLSFRGESYKEIQSTLTREWRNSFIDVSFLEQTTASFMWYYRFRKYKRKRFPYMQIKTLKKLDHVP